ncbi:MAG: response regulator transcription factor [Bacteroidetes bacterium]|nr:response regulator transcription factor [Bacteroidota bacterium]MCW5894405.1 response regulator transcription factor [Bacteroidota bacterium]
MMTNPETTQLTVWVVEDNDSYRENISELVRQTPALQFEHAFSSCEGALEELHRSAFPDIILMDIGLPGMNGIEGVQRVKAISPETRVVMLTVFDENDMIFRAICAGASGYLLKSESTDRIMTSLQEVLNGGAPMNAQIAAKVVDMFSRLAAPKGNYGLTAREREILQCLVDGLSKKQIADKLFLSFHTIDMHMRGIYTKLQVHSRSGAVAKALKENLL